MTRVVWIAALLGACVHAPVGTPSAVEVGGSEDRGSAVPVAVPSSEVTPPSPAPQPPVAPAERPRFASRTDVADWLRRDGEARGLVISRDVERAELDVVAVEDASGVTVCRKMAEYAEDDSSHERIARCFREQRAQLAVGPPRRIRHHRRRVVIVAIEREGQVVDLVLDADRAWAHVREDAARGDVAVIGEPLFEPPWPRSVAADNAARRRDAACARTSCAPAPLVEVAEQGVDAPDWARILDEGPRGDSFIAARDGARRVQVVAEDASGLIASCVMLAEDEVWLVTCPRQGLEVRQARFTDVFLPGSIMLLAGTGEPAFGLMDVPQNEPVMLVVLTRQGGTLVERTRMDIGTIGFVRYELMRSDTWRWFYTPTVVGEGRIALRRDHGFTAPFDRRTMTFGAQRRIRAARPDPERGEVVGLIPEEIAGEWVLGEEFFERVATAPGGARRP